jgi:hypothetical protein
MPSTVIRLIAYDTAQSELSVTFVPTGKTYAFSGVPEDVYRDFLAAFSKGQFFNANIRDRYPHREIKRRA